MSAHRDAGVVLRTAEPGDRNAVTDLIHALNVHEAGLVADRLQDRAAAEAYYRRLQERIAAQEGRVLLAQEHGTPIGCLALVFGVDEPFIREDLRRHGIVIDLVVAPGSRGRGIGRMLLAEAERLTREKGFARLFIGVLDANEGARRAYEALGFTPYTRTLVKEL